MKTVFGVLTLAAIASSEATLVGSRLPLNPHYRHLVGSPVVQPLINAPLAASRFGGISLLQPSAPLVAPFVAPHNVAQPLINAPFIPTAFASAHPIAHSPVVKSVLEHPSEVTQEIVAHHLPLLQHAPFAHHAAPLVHAPALAHHAVAPFAAHHAAPIIHAPAPISAHHAVAPFLNLGRKKREAEAEAEALADPYAYHYASVTTPYSSYGTFVPDPLPYHPLVAHGYRHQTYGRHPHFGYYGRPYGGFFGNYHHY